ncbi:MAG TPA: class I SAM-dependent methyltransferase [Fontimonas sp.]
MEKHINKYYDASKAHEAVQKGQHRAWVGGMWDEIGKLQLDFLLAQGLPRDAAFIDVGCGCFRAGVHLVNYLDSAGYYGIDISQELLDTGYEREIIPAGLQAKLPRANLVANGDFDISGFGRKFDVGIAQSVFTHLPLNHIRLCLERLAPHFAVGGVFYATTFIVPPGHDWSAPLVHERGGIRTLPTDDPYHYRVEDYAFCAASAPWKFEFIGDWNHPRNQQMLKFTRTV